MVEGNASDSFRLAKEITADIPKKAEDEDGRIVEVDDMKKVVRYSGDAFRKFQLNPRYTEVMDFCNKIVGLPRNYSTHAAGVVISDIPLPDFIPVRRDKNGSYAVQYEKDQVEEMGLVKMDFLGLITLDIFSETIKQANDIGIRLPHPDDLIDDPVDEKAYKIISSGHTIGCFQIEGATLKPLCKPMKAKSIEDIAFINAVGRPGCTREERKQFIMRRDGKEASIPPHPLLKEILAHTYGISIYEEDLLHLAGHVAGWDLSEADGLRKVTKLKEKGAALADRLEKKFVNDCMERRSLSERDAQFIWDKVVIPYSKYGFNKAHAIAYSILGYQSAYYKYYAVAPFFAAVLNSKIRGSKKSASGAEEKTNDIKRDVKRFKVNIDVCDINKSKQYYVAASRKNIVTGLGAIKGLGDSILDQVIARQPYEDFDDFVLRNLKKVTKSHVAALAKAGAFDTLGVSRKYVHDHFPTFKDELKKFLKKQDETLFEAGDRNRPLPEAIEGFTYSKHGESSEEWTLQERLTREKEVLGEYVSGSAMDLFPGFFQGGLDLSIDEIKTRRSKEKISFEGVVIAVKELKVKKKGRLYGRIMAKLTVENLRGECIGVTLWPDQYDECQEILSQGDTPVRGIFEVNEWGGEKGLLATNRVKFHKRNIK
jgi:DNA polymerase-3 subunit alpha